MEENTTQAMAGRTGPGRPRDPDLARQRREAILRQAITHFAREGFPKADMGAIAEAAGCAKGTIYNYFKSKRELFRAAVDYVMLGLLAATHSSSATDPIERFGHAIQSFLAYFDAHPEYIELLIQERAEFKDRETPTYLEYRKTHCEQARIAFRSLIDAGRFREVPLDRTFDILSNLLYGTIFNNYFAGRSTSLEQQAADIKDILLRGLLSPKAAAK